MTRFLPALASDKCMQTCFVTRLAWSSKLAEPSFLPVLASDKCMQTCFVTRLAW